ncbi:uncharacterized protein LOC124148009 isoform X3 [Haliotis rufescens]|uniref:uncharacterized protein LOC124148009 isoform X3 n=1 Tax=Haliotis rufescens TaxID=6454 RepID=UPI00201F0B98|nr:uncharacterized protein LOC124148009 isoform X3 [Haliotis rufescens]
MVGEITCTGTGIRIWKKETMKCCHPLGLLTCITFVSGITGARLTTSPTQITIGGSNPTSQLTLRCSPDAPGITLVFSIEIGKKSSTGSNQPVIRMGSTDSSVQVVDTGLQQRMTASGSITGATGSIQFILTDLRCTDAASTYYCSTLYLAGTAGSDETTTNITARTYPEQIEMFPTPDRVSYDNGQLISFRCTGRIGNQFDDNNLQNLWTWEWRSIDNEFTSWTRYPNDQNITYEPPTPVSVSGGCQYNGASTLLHTVSNLDNGRQFRCSVINEDYSDNKTVLVIEPTTRTTTIQPITGARLTTSPTQITIGGSGPTSQLTVRCSPDAPGITQVYSIEIGKKSSTGSNLPVIRMGSTDSSVQVVDTGLQQRMTASGSITGATGSIQFILTDLRCTDAASTYYCSTLYLAGTAGSDETTTNITARTYPEQIEMFPTPDSVSYDNGQLISFRCTGRIGNQFDNNNLQNLWTWEWRSIDNEFTSWTRYPNDQNITYEPPTPVSVSGGCQYNGASTLLHTVSNLDNGRQFRCSVINEDYSDNKTVLVIEPTTRTTTIQPITGARLTTSPTQITIGGSNPTSQLTLRCSPDAPGITLVFSIEIGKKSSTGSNQPVIRMGSTDSSVQVVDTGLQQRMTASGSITGATGSIQFILTDLRCTDAASTYYCSTLYLAGTAGSDETTTNITARTYPEQIEMFPTPDRVSYDNGQLISFRCTGRIGNQFDDNNLQNLWTWEWRSIDNEFTSWTRYPNDQNITYEPPTPVSVSGGCQYNGASTLLHTVSNLDNGRQFRCSVINEDYSDNKTVLVIEPTTRTTTIQPITGARLTTSPTQITIGGSGPTSQLTVRCSPDAPGITQVYSIEIGKKSSTGFHLPVIRTGSTDSSVQVVDTGLQQRMTASGSITGATGSIQFILTDLRCTDAASTYYCSTLYLAGTAGSDETTTNITARTYPEQIEMFPTPDSVSYDNGQLISFRCTGRIGNQFDNNNLQNLWTWEWRSIDNEFTSWTRYPNDQNITYEPPTPVSVSGGCQYNGASTLLHTVSNLDNGRQFRCSVINEDYSDNKTVLVIETTTRTPTIQPNARPSPPTDFYCTEHTASSVKMQWTYSDTRSRGYVFILSFWQKDSTVWSVTNVTADTGIPQTRRTHSVPRLQSDTLYYFRLLVDGGLAGQSEAVTSTCFTGIDECETSKGMMVGKNAAISVSVVLLLSFF